MEITDEQYARIKESLPIQRGNVSLSNLQFLNAVLYEAEHGSKWRGLPKRFGNWHTIYTCMNRWSKSGVMDRIFEKLQLEQVVRIRIEAFSLNSTSVKVRLDGAGALKEAGPKTSANLAEDGRPRFIGCRGCSNRNSLVQQMHRSLMT
jgi:transposase